MFKKMFVLCLVAMVAAGCVGNPDAIKVAVKMMAAAKDLAPGLYYAQATAGFGIAPLNSVFYKHAEKKADGSDITVLVANATPEFWSEVTKILALGGALVGASAVHGVSFPAAKAAVTSASAQGGTGQGGSGGSGGAGGTSKSCSGTNCTAN